MFISLSNISAVTLQQPLYKLVKLLFTKYKSKLIKVTMVSVHMITGMCQLFSESLSQ